MKYRIVEKVEGFVIQKKLLFWWVNFSYRPLYNAGINLGWKYGPPTTDYWESKDDAVKQINFIRQYPIKYKGHTIYATNRYKNPTYYTTCSLVSDGIIEYASEHLSNLYKWIDDIEHERLERKKSKIIINTFDEHGNII